MRIFRFIVGFAFLCFGAIRAGGQGLLVDEALYKKAPCQSLYSDGGKSENEALKSVLKKDLKPYCPIPQDQGEINSCTGWAAGYGALTIAYAIQEGWENETERITDRAFSTLFIYNQIREDKSCDSALSHITHALEKLKTVGNIRFKDFDMDPTDCDKMPSQKQLSEAAKFRIMAYSRLFENSRADFRVKILQVKKSLLKNRPVIIGMFLRENFSRLNEKDRFWRPHHGKSRIVEGRHAMVVIGFDEGKQAFEVMNSWGERWGQKGFMWIKYDDFAEYCLYAYDFSLYEKKTKPGPIVRKDSRRRLFGKLELKEAVIKSYTEYSFEPDCITHVGEGIYELCEQDWRIEKRYQLEAHSIRNSTYFYAFSIDNEGEIRIHWPRDEALDEKFTGIRESAEISNEHVRLTIPTDTTTGLKLEKKGEEYLVFFFSQSPIRDFNSLIQKVKAGTGPIPLRVRKILGRRAIREDNIEFDPQKISFDSWKAYSTSILPVFVQIVVY